jgi:hypothetical protein
MHYTNSVLEIHAARRGLASVDDMDDTWLGVYRNALLRGKIREYEGRMRFTGALRMFHCSQGD